MEINTTAELELIISNGGNKALTVTSIDYPEGFSGDWSEGTIPASSFQNVTVTFAPTDVIDYTGSIELTSDATIGENAIDVSGKGIIILSSEMDEGVAAGFTLYPNPAFERVLLSFSESKVGQAVTLQLTDLSGRIVWTRSFLAQNDAIYMDLNGLPSGLYLVVLTDQDGTTIRKLKKE